MRVPEHYRAGAGRYRLQIQIGEDVDDVDGVTIERDDRRVWQCERPAAFVDVAAHSADRRSNSVMPWRGSGGAMVVTVDLLQLGDRSRPRQVFVHLSGPPC